MKHASMRRSPEDRAFIALDWILVLLIFVCVAYPLWYILVMSFDGDICNTSVRLLRKKPPHAGSISRVRRL